MHTVHAFFQHLSCARRPRAFIRPLVYSYPVPLTSELFPAFEQAAEARISFPRAAAATMSSGGCTNPFLKELPISNFSRIGNFGRHVRLLTIKSKEGRNRCDHICHARPVGHHVGRVEFDGAVGHSAFGFTNSRLDYRFYDWRNYPAGSTPSGSPECY
jgi:hypothetical protein